MPIDPQTKESYRYEKVGAMAFKLCATFATAGGTNQVNGRSVPTPVDLATNGKPLQDSWQHAAGEVCFDRTIDPERYPPYPKQKTF